MGIIVTKFGGSSLASAGLFRRVLAIIQKSDDRRCIVLSAPGIYQGEEKVTNLLCEAWKRCTTRENYMDAIERVANRYGEIGRELNVCDMKKRAMRSLCSALTISEAHVLSRGEFLCAELFSEFSGIPMRDAALLLAFGKDGKLDKAKTLRQLAEAIRACPRLIIPGFYGVDAGGRIRTLPRNGSDITGALAAAACSAELYENWTDVPGLMTADPSIVPDARPIPRISYRQMRRLAAAGAKVLHPECLAPVQERGIPVRLCSTFQPEQAGTLVCEEDASRVACLIVKDGPRIDGRETAQISLLGASPSLIMDLRRMKEALFVDVKDDISTVVVPRSQDRALARRLHGRLID